MKDRIQELRNQGKTYNQIALELGCSKSTVCYYCADGQKEKHRVRSQRSRKNNVIAHKIGSFKCPSAKYRNRRREQVNSNPMKLLRHKSDDFQRRRGGRYGDRNIVFNYKDILSIYGEKTICYLTGDPIDLKEPRSYNFDHIVPATRGGDNSLDNLGIAIRAANTVKGDLTLSEFLSLCEKVLTHHGYEVRKGGTWS